MARPTASSPLNSPSHSTLHNFHVNVKKWGAVGDGTTDDTSAITTAIADVNTNGGTLFFPAGTYKVTSTIDLSSYSLLSWEGGHLGPIGLISGVHPPCVVIDGSSMSSGACVSSDRAGGTANYTIRNIVFKGKDQGFKLKDAGGSRFENCGFICTTTGADSCGLLQLNSFVTNYDYCAFHSASNTLPAVRMRGDNTAINVNSSSGTFRDCWFFTGGVQFEANVTPTNGGTGIFHNCIIENSTMALTTIVEGGGVGAYTCTGFMLFNCQVADPIGTPPLVELNSAACQLLAPVIGSSTAGTYSRAIQVDAGRVTAAQVFGGQHVTNSSGVPYIGTVGSYEARKANGQTWVGTSADLTETQLTGNAGPFLRMGRSGDTYARAGIDTDGTHYWGPGAADSGGWDTNLYRSAANVLKTDDKLLIADELELDGALNHDGTTVGFYGVTPATRPTAYTQTYATADKTHANPTAAALTVTDGTGTNDGTIGAITADASVIAAVQEIAAQIAKLVADDADTKQLVNSVIDDLQTLGILQ